MTWKTRRRGTPKQRGSRFKTKSNVKYRMPKTTKRVSHDDWVNSKKGTNPRRRTAYYVLYKDGKRKRFTSKQDCLLTAQTRDRLHREFPKTFPGVLKVVRTREERMMINGRIPVWGILKETELHWKNSKDSKD